MSRETREKEGWETGANGEQGRDGKQQKFASQSRIEIITRETRARKGWRNTDADANADVGGGCWEGCKPSWREEKSLEAAETRLEMQIHSRTK